MRPPKMRRPNPRDRSSADIKSKHQHSTSAPSAIESAIFGALLGLAMAHGLAAWIDWGLGVTPDCAGRVDRVSEVRP